MRQALVQYRALLVSLAIQAPVAFAPPSEGGFRPIIPESLLTQPHCQQRVGQVGNPFYVVSTAKELGLSADESLPSLPKTQGALFGSIVRSGTFSGGQPLPPNALIQHMRHRLAFFARQSASGKKTPGGSVSSDQEIHQMLGIFAGVPGVAQSEEWDAFAKGVRAKVTGLDQDPSSSLQELPYPMQFQAALHADTKTFNQVWSYVRLPFRERYSFDLLSPPDVLWSGFKWRTIFSPERVDQLRADETWFDAEIFFFNARANVFHLITLLSSRD